MLEFSTCLEMFSDSLTHSFLHTGHKLVKLWNKHGHLKIEAQSVMLILGKKAMIVFSLNKVKAVERSLLGNLVDV